MNNKVKKRKHRCWYNIRVILRDGYDFSFTGKEYWKCKCGKVRPLNNKVEG